MNPAEAEGLIVKLRLFYPHEVFTENQLEWLRVRLAPYDCGVADKCLALAFEKSSTHADFSLLLTLIRERTPGASRYQVEARRNKQEFESDEQHVKSVVDPISDSEWSRLAQKIAEQNGLNGWIANYEKSNPILRGLVVRERESHAGWAETSGENLREK